MGDEEKNSRHFARELFEGEDVTKGSEIVNYLKSEGIGVQVISRLNRKKKTHFNVDRAPGEENFSVTSKEETDDKLLGIVVPVKGDEKKFIFISAEEEGFVFICGSELCGKFDSDINTTIALGNITRFTDYFNYLTREGGTSAEYSMKRILSEGKNPTEFENLVVESVQNERQKILDNKTKRSQSRRNIFSRLWGSGD